VAGGRGARSRGGSHGRHEASAERAGIVVAHGVTQPVFGYADAIRERVFVDYGTAERVQRTGDGVVTGTEEDCWGSPAVWGGYAEDACYLPSGWP